MRIAIIPARAGSERIKNKNITDFLGKPMIAYALEAAKKSKLFDKIHVSTDSLETKKIAEQLGFPVEFLRPDELSGNVVGIAPVLHWVIQEFRKRGENYEDICCIMPAAPLLEAEDLVKANQIFLEGGRKYPLLAIAKIPVPIEWSFRLEDNNTIVPAMPEALQIRSQDLKKAYYEAGPLSFFKAEHLDPSFKSTEVKFLSYLLPSDRAVDIDDADDLALAKTLYLGRMAQQKP